MDHAIVSNRHGLRTKVELLMTVSAKKSKPVTNQTQKDEELDHCLDDRGELIKIEYQQIYNSKRNQQAEISDKNSLTFVADCKETGRNQDQNADDAFQDNARFKPIKTRITI